MQASVTKPTMPIGMSRSVIGSVSALPAFRARDAAIAPARPLISGFTKLQKSPNRRNADRTGANESDFAAPRVVRERRGSCCEIAGHRRKMRNAPAPTDQRADQHRDPD